MNTNLWRVATIVLAACMIARAEAFPVSVTHLDMSDCDTLAVPTQVDELGVVSFPPDELILATDVATPLKACTASNGFGSVLVSMVNTTNRVFTNLWYVADPETLIANFDGLVNGEEAFKIDYAGTNVPLVFESSIANALFEPGEQWDFVIDGYFNSLGIPASAFHSVGLVGGGSSGDFQSSGSIIATPVPEPSTALLLGAALLSGLGIRRTTRCCSTVDHFS